MKDELVRKHNDWVQEEIRLIETKRKVSAEREALLHQLLLQLPDDPDFLYHGIGDLCRRLQHPYQSRYHPQELQMLRRALKSAVKL